MRRGLEEINISMSDGHARTTPSLQQTIAYINDRRESLIQASVTQLQRLMEPWSTCFTPSKGEPSVIMFVGLRGSGITSTCTKYATYHQRKGWNPAVVCADRRRADALDPLKLNAAQMKVPCYGSSTETDIVKFVVEGVEKVKKENCDLIIIDTSGPHKTDTNFFEELHRLFEATKPDLVVNVMDGSTARSALDQYEAFMRSVPVGALIFTKMDHAIGRDLVSCILATRCPVIFIGTGEHMTELEVFDVEAFVRRYIGVCDWRDVMEKFAEIVPLDQRVKFEQKLREGTFTLRDMYELYRLFLTMDHFEQTFSEFPDQSTIKKHMTVMDSMTAEELESSNPKLMNKTRMMRIARGSGRPLKDVEGMWKRYKRLTGMLNSHRSQVIG